MPESVGGNGCRKPIFLCNNHGFIVFLQRMHGFQDRSGFVGLPIPADTKARCKEIAVRKLGEAEEV